MFNIQKKFLILFLGRLTQAVVSILSIRVMTEMLSTAEVGHQYLVNSIILWFSLVLINPMGMFVNRHVHEWHRQKQLLAAIKKLNVYFLTIAVLSLPIILITIFGFNLGQSLPVHNLVVYVGCYIFFSTWFQTLSSFFNLFDFQKQFVSLNVISQVFGLLFAVLGVQLFGATGLNWLTGLLLGQALALIIGTVLYRIKFSVSEQPLSQKLSLFNRQTLLFCYPIAITTLFMWFITQGYRLYVEKYIGVEALASLGVGLGLAASVAALVEALTTQFFYPKFYSSIAESTTIDRQAAWSALWKNASTIYIPFCFLTVAAAPFLVKVLTAEQFHHVVIFVVIGAFVELFRQLSNIAYLASHAEKKTKNTIVPYLSGAVALAGLLFYLKTSSDFTIYSVTVALLLSGIITLIANLIAVFKVQSPRLELKSIAVMSLMSVPVLAIYFANQNQSLMISFLLTSVGGLYCLLIIRYRLKL